MEAIGTRDRVAPIARSPLDSARGRRNRKHRLDTYTSHIHVPVNVNANESPSPK